MQTGTWATGILVQTDDPLQLWRWPNCMKFIVDRESDLVNFAASRRS